MAFREGFEPPTDGLEGRCSIQLSYRNVYSAINYNITPSVCKASNRLFVLAEIIGVEQILLNLQHRDLVGERFFQRWNQLTVAVIRLIEIQKVGAVGDRQIRKDHVVLIGGQNIGPHEVIKHQIAVNHIQNGRCDVDCAGRGVDNFPRHVGRVDYKTLPHHFMEVIGVDPDVVGVSVVIHHVRIMIGIDHKQRTVQHTFGLQAIRQQPHHLVKLDQFQHVVADFGIELRMIRIRRFQLIGVFLELRLIVRAVHRIGQQRHHEGVRKIDVVLPEIPHLGIESIVEVGMAAGNQVLLEHDRVIAVVGHHLAAIVEPFVPAVKIVRIVPAVPQLRRQRVGIDVFAVRVADVRTPVVGGDRRQSTHPHELAVAGRALLEDGGEVVVEGQAVGVHLVQVWCQVLIDESRLQGLPDDHHDVVASVAVAVVVGPMGGQTLEVRVHFRFQCILILLWTDPRQIQEMIVVVAVFFTV